MEYVNHFNKKIQVLDEAEVLVSLLKKVMP